MPVETFTIQTERRRQITDITGHVAGILSGMDVSAGLICVSVPHCTCCVYVNENETGLVEDTLALLDSIAARGNWRHDRIDDNADAHLYASVVGNSVTLPLRGGQMELGTWQRVMLVELDGPRSRRVTVTAITDR